MTYADTRTWCAISSRTLAQGQELLFTCTFRPHEWIADSRTDCPLSGSRERSTIQAWSGPRWGRSSQPLLVKKQKKPIFGLSTALTQAGVLLFTYIFCAVLGLLPICSPLSCLDVQWAPHAHTRRRPALTSPAPGPCTFSLLSWF